MQRGAHHHHCDWVRGHAQGWDYAPVDELLPPTTPWTIIFVKACERIISRTHQNTSDSLKAYMVARCRHAHGRDYARPLPRRRVASSEKFASSSSIYDFHVIQKKSS